MHGSIFNIDSAVMSRRMDASTQGADTSTTKTQQSTTGRVTVLEAPDEEPFKLSELQVCGKYVAYLSVVYFIMVLTQVCNLLFMSFAGKLIYCAEQCLLNCL